MTDHANDDYLDVEIDHFKIAFDEMMDPPPPMHSPSVIGAEHMAELLGFAVEEQSPIRVILDAIEVATEERLLTALSCSLGEEISHRALRLYLGEIIDKDRKPRHSTEKAIEELIALTAHLDGHGGYPSGD